MNRIHKHIWSRTLERLVVVCEQKRGSRGKKSTRRSLSVLTAVAALAAPVYAGDLPTGGQVVAGAGSIETNGNAMTIQQTTDRMIANWLSFSVGADNSVTFHQPNSNSVALNRVVGDSPSQILGNLSANGKVFLVNPNGVVFGQGAQVNVGALVASTLGISNEEFFAANYRFSGEGGEIHNAGTLGGAVVALIAPVVTNEGTINGSAALAGGTDVTLDFDGDGLLSVKVNAATLATLVENRGLIQTHGGTAILTARGASDALASVVNNSGVIEAQSLNRQGGRILLDAIDGQSTVTGTLNASSGNAQGGRVVVTGERVLLDDSARLAATGGAGGGEIYVGGSWQASDPSIRQAVGTAVASGAVLDASATNVGDGGTVVAWSDIHDANSATRAHGTFLARGGVYGGDGGRIETSGHWLETTGVKGDASAPQGQAGEWLFDPYNVTISAVASSNGSFNAGDPNIWTPSSTSTILNTDINSRLDAGTNVRITTGVAGTEIGDIYVQAPIIKSAGADTTLTLRATNSILVDQDITSTSGRLNVVLDADYNNSNNTGDGAGVVMLSADIDTNGGSLNFGSGRTATIGGVSTLVGGDVFVGGVGARTLTTQGGTLDVRGEMILANTSGLSVTTGGGNIRFWGLLNSGNQYAYVDGPDGQANSWAYARTDARNGTAGGAALGDSYLVTIISRLENSVAVAAANYRGSWIGAYRADHASRNWSWADGPEASAHFFTQNGSNNGGSATAGYYSNFGGGEPNGCVTSAACETVGQFFGTGGQWNDLGATTVFSATQGSIYAVLGYVRETNIDNSPLVVDAGSGTVTFSGGVGGTKALASLDVSGGAVTVGSGARTSGTLAIDALTGDLAITGAIRSNDTTASAIILNAGVNAVAGTAAGGNILVGNGSSITVGAGGRATLFTGGVSGSTGLTTLVGSGTGRFRYNSDETATNYTTALGGGAYAIFREQPTIAITANETITYGQTPAPSWSASGLQNGDTSGQAITSGPAVAVDGAATLSSSGRYTAGTHTIDVTGAATGGLGYAFSIADGTLTVNAATISAITGIAAQNRIYDGTTAATLNTGAASFTGMIAGDVLNVGSGSGAFVNRNAGTGKTVNITSLTLGGTDAANYVLADNTASTTANITRAALTVSTADVVKSYDGTLTANGSAVVTAGQLFGADALNGGAFAFTDKNASAGDKTVTVAGVTVNDGNAGNNYDLTLNANTTSTINRATIANITNIAALDRIYNGTTAATLATGSATFNGMVGGDVLTVGTGSGAFLDKHVGTDKTVNITGLALAGADAGNYTLASSIASTTADITPATITAITGIAAQNRVYDGTTAATLNTGAALFNGMIVGDVLNVGASNGAFVDRNAGTGKTVNITGLALAGTDATNYVLADTTASTTAIIARAGLTVTTADVIKTYDGTVSANGSAVITAGQLFGADALSGGAFAFTDKNASAGDKTVTVAGVTVTDGNAGNNYDIMLVANTTSTINRATIADITDITALDRTYDGTTAATLNTSAASFNGMVAGDVLNVGSGSGSFIDRNAGTGKTVEIEGLALAGTDAANYVLADNTASTTANIARAGLTVSTADVVKTYDGTLAANGSAVITAGQLFGSDALSGGSFAFTDKNASAGDKTVTVAGVAVNDGNNGGNYDLVLAANTTSTINRATIAGVTNITALDRTYDSTTAATLNTGNATFNGMVAGDVLTIGTASGAFLDKHVGSDKTVSITGLALSGTDATNYVLASSSSSATADISPATISGITGIAALNRVYNGTTAATLNSGGAIFNGGFAGDALTVGVGSGSFLDKNAGTGKTVNITGLTLAGADAGNYVLASNTASTTADISPAAITGIGGITALSRDYDGTTAATLDTDGAFFGSVIAGDSLTVASSAGVFANPEPGVHIPVLISGLTLGGADAGNYLLADDTAVTTATITRTVEPIPPASTPLPDPVTPPAEPEDLVEPPPPPSEPSPTEPGAGTTPETPPATGGVAPAALAAIEGGLYDRKSVRNTELTAMSVIEAPGSAVLVTFTLMQDGKLTVYVPDDVVPGGLGSENDLRRLASEKLGVEPSRILSIQVISVARSRLAANGG